MKNMPDMMRLFTTMFHTRRGVYIGNSSYVNNSISNSKSSKVDEEEVVLSRENSNEVFQEKTLERGLKLRHVQLIALGGCLGMYSLTKG